MSEDPRRFLVVGLGGGTLPMFLRKHYPNATIDAVDIDPEFVDTAKNFLRFREDELMRAHIADGRQFRDAGNKILLALPRKQPLNREELMQLARKVSAARRFSFDLGEPVTYGFPAARETSQHGRVLQDRNLKQRKQRSP